MKSNRSHSTKQDKRLEESFANTLHCIELQMPKLTKDIKLLKYIHKASLGIDDFAIEENKKKHKQEIRELRRELREEKTEIRRLSDENRILEREIAKINNKLNQKTQFISMKQIEMQENVFELSVKNGDDQVTHIEMRDLNKIIK